MKPAMKPIGQCSAIEVLSMIGYKMRLCHPKSKLGQLSIIVKDKAAKFCVINETGHIYKDYNNFDKSDPLCVAVSYSKPMDGLSIVANKLLSLIRYHADTSLGSEDILLLKVDFSLAPEKLTIQFNSEEPSSYNARKVLLLF